MNTQTQEALKMAIEALAMDNDCECGRSNKIVSALANAIQACKEALAQPAHKTRLVSYAPDGATCTLNIGGEEVYFNREQPAQEPVLIQWYDEEEDEWEDTDKRYYPHYADEGHKIRFLYTHPAPAWQGLSDDEIHNYADHNFAFASEHFDEIFNFARAIEQALKEKNHG